jgi:hypothetical protein
MRSTASVRFVEMSPPGGGGQPGREDLLDLLTLAPYLAAISPAHPLTNLSVVSLSLGAGSLASFNLVAARPFSGRGLTGRELTPHARDIWGIDREEAAIPSWIARASMDSPLELVLNVAADTTLTLTAFSLLVHAVRRVYRGVRGLEVDAVRIDAEVAVTGSP